MTFKQHIPGFISGLEPAHFAFESLEKLLDDPVVHRWAVDPTFYRFSLSHGDTLMAEMDSGEKWWVVGYIKDIDTAGLDLPVWTAPTKKGTI